MRAQKVVIGDPESQVVVGTVDVVKSIGRSVRSFVSAIKSFYHLLERTEFLGYFIVVGKSDYLSDIEFESIAKFTEELLCGKRISTVAVSNETEKGVLSDA